MSDRCLVNLLSSVVGTSFVSLSRRSVIEKWYFSILNRNTCMIYQPSSPSNQVRNVYTVNAKLIENKDV